jgi:nucleotide-binding universal stress UspA family protein
VLKKILFPAKFEEFCLDILKSIACLKSAGLEEVVLLHVIDTASLYTEVGWGTVFNLELIEREANKRLDSYAEYLRGEGISSKTLVCKGRLVSEIIRVATNEDVSLIVAGRQRRGILGELFVGSTTHGIIRQSSVPVLVPSITLSKRSTEKFRISSALTCSERYYIRRIGPRLRNAQPNTSGHFNKREHQKLL